MKMRTLIRAIIGIFFSMLYYSLDITAYFLEKLVRSCTSSPFLFLLLIFIFIFIFSFLPSTGPVNVWHGSLCLLSPYSFALLWEMCCFRVSLNFILYFVSKALLSHYIFKRRWNRRRCVCRCASRGHDSSVSVCLRVSSKTTSPAHKIFPALAQDTWSEVPGRISFFSSIYL